MRIAEFLRQGKLSSCLVRLNGAGLWPSFRTRPFSMVPRLADVPASVFINAMDTNPLAADPAVIIASFREDFVAGQQVVARLSGGRVHRHS